MIKYLGWLIFLQWFSSNPHIFSTHVMRVFFLPCINSVVESHYISLVLQGHMQILLTALLLQNPQPPLPCKPLNMSIFCVHKTSAGWSDQTF
jgi:hypothetical protein